MTVAEEVAGSTMQDMTSKTPDIKRFDRSQPPPGWQIQANGGLTLAEALAQAWLSAKAAFDPPGTETYHDGASNMHNAFGVAHVPTGTWRLRVLGEPLYLTFRSHDEARAAAWARYWKRVECPVTLDWPDCLRWADGVVDGRGRLADAEIIINSQRLIGVEGDRVDLPGFRVPGLLRFALDASSPALQVLQGLEGQTCVVEIIAPVSFRGWASAKRVSGEKTKRVSLLCSEDVRSW